MSDIAEQLVDQVKEAISHQRSIVIEGRGTKKHLGRQLANDASTIAVAKHSGIISYEPVELVMTARAGTSLAEIDAALAEHGQAMPSDPARFNGQASIAGSLAANMAGPARPWAGSLRDHVLGVSLINGKGEHLSFGGQVMKNVAGYDVSRLQAGAMGTLGVMTQLSFKVLPKPAMEMTLQQSVSIDEAVVLMNQLGGQSKPLTAACWVDGTLFLRLSGAQSAVEGTASQWGLDSLSPQTAADFWSGLRDQEIDFFSTRSKSMPLWRFSVNSSAPALMPEADWLFDWAGALRWLKGEHDENQLRDWAAKHGGEVVLYQGGDRSGDIAATPNQTMQKLQQNLKRSFDPDALFNIGRLYRWM